MNYVFVCYCFVTLKYPKVFRFIFKRGFFYAKYSVRGSFNEKQKDVYGKRNFTLDLKCFIKIG